LIFVKFQSTGLRYTSGFSLCALFYASRKSSGSFAIFAVIRRAASANGLVAHAALPLSLTLAVALRREPATS
jgi:hypothetical protein